MRILLPTFILLLYSGLFATPAHAQLNSSFTNPEEGVVLQPAYPQPGDEVTATLNNYSGGSYGAGITWTFDGNVIQNAENKREATFIVGETGDTETLTTTLSSPNGATQTYTTVIKPVYLDIIIEPQTRTPNFYLGRALPSIDSLVNATALISGHGFKNPDLVYTWRLNQKVLNNGSVRGQNQITFTTPRGETSTLSLQVTELDGTVISRRSILIPSVRPEIHFYEVNALYGTKQTAITSSVPLISDTLVVRAEPYYLDSRVFNSPDLAEWKLNGTKTTTDDNPYEVTLQHINSSGSARLEFRVNDIKQVLQGAQAQTTITF